VALGAAVAVAAQLLHAPGEPVTHPLELGQVGQPRAAVALGRLGVG
jgi:hypothetical protein